MNICWICQLRRSDVNMYAIHTNAVCYITGLPYVLRNIESTHNKQPQNVGRRKGAQPKPHLERQRAITLRCFCLFLYFPPGIVCYVWISEVNVCGEGFCVCVCVVTVWPHLWTPSRRLPGIWWGLRKTIVFVMVDENMLCTAMKMCCFSNEWRDPSEYSFHGKENLRPLSECKRTMQWRI